MSPRVAPADRLITLPDGVPELTLGWEVARWVVKYLKQPNGPRAGHRFELTDSQLRFLLWWYAVDEDGQWLYRRAVRRLPKGSGKSPWAAVVALAEFCGPVRLRDFDPKRPGGCIGRPVDMPWVQCAATAESQVANTFRMIRAFAARGSRLVVEYGLDPGKTQYYKSPEGTLEVITSSPTAAEGAESSFVVQDETEYWLPNNGGTELSSVLADNAAKSGSRVLSTCIAWEPGTESVAEADWNAWVAQEEGRTRGESKILYDARVAPPDTDMADPGSLRTALDHVYGDCHWVDRRAVMERIYDPASRPEDSIRKYLNRPVASTDAWVTQEQWSALADPDRIVHDGEEIALFFDGSKSRDATALIGCCLDDGHVFVVGIWEPDPNDPDSAIPVAEVDSTVARAFETYRVYGFFADVKEWESFVKVSWPEQYADQLLVSALPTGKEPQSIAWDMRSRTYEFTTAAELTEAEIRDRTFTHDGNSVLGRHVTNARIAPNRWGISVRKESPKSPRKIDAAVAMIGARMVRRHVVASSEYQRRKRRTTGKGRIVVLS